MQIELSEIGPSALARKAVYSATSKDRGLRLHFSVLVDREVVS